MAKFENKIDFAVIITVTNANPNGDPQNGNRPRTTYENIGEISDVCIKRKIRNRLMDLGEGVFVQTDEKKVDKCDSLKARLDKACSEEDPKTPTGEKVEKKDKSNAKKAEADIKKIALEKWIDVRSFGQVFAFEKKFSLGIRGPVSIQPAFSVDPVTVISSQITKSVNSKSGEEGKASDTMGIKHRVEFGIYKVYGSINVEIASRTDFSNEDAEAIKKALRTLFVNDESSARPAGSIEVHKLYWWKHNNPLGQYPTAKVHRALKVTRKEGIEEPKTIEDYTIEMEELPGLVPEVLDGQ